MGRNGDKKREDTTAKNSAEGAKQTKKAPPSVKTNKKIPQVRLFVNLGTTSGSERGMQARKTAQNRQETRHNGITFIGTRKLTKIQKSEEKFDRNAKTCPVCPGMLG
jgi:hypothetical protein